jgi:hypothetical protein
MSQFQTHALATLPACTNPTYPCNRKLVEPLCTALTRQKSPACGRNRASISRSFSPQLSHYTDYVISTPCNEWEHLILTEFSLVCAAEEMHGSWTSMGSLGGRRVVWWKYVGVVAPDWIVLGVPLATEPGISLIILTPMKILRRNLNRSTFVVWEMWRHRNMWWKWPSFASRQDWTRRAILCKVLVLSASNKHWLLQRIPIHFPAILCELTHYTNTHEQQPYCGGTLSPMTEISREARQAGNRLATWRTAAPCRNN